MRTLTLLFAGVMSFSIAFGSDPAFEERFKMKTGRYTPAEEARRTKESLTAKHANEEPILSCEKHGCCTRTQQTVSRSATRPASRMRRHIFE